VIIPLIIALVSLVISIATFYLTQMQPPKLKSLSGPFIKVYYADCSEGGAFGLLLPITFMNQSIRTGTICNTAIRLYRKDLSDQSYFMQWREFHKLNVEKDEWEFDEIAHAIAMPGRSTVTKVLWFWWDATSQPKLVLQKGAYRIDIYFWEHPDQAPHKEPHGFVVTDSIYTELEAFRAQKEMTTKDIRLDQQIEENRFMTDHEAKRLLS
jgi:hypothetical protein